MSSSSSSSTSSSSSVATHLSSVFPWSTLSALSVGSGLPELIPLLAAYHIVLFRYSGLEQADIRLTVTAHNAAGQPLFKYATIVILKPALTVTQLLHLIAHTIMQEQTKQEDNASNNTAAVSVEQTAAAVVNEGGHIPWKQLSQSLSSSLAQTLQSDQIETILIQSSKSAEASGGGAFDAQLNMTLQKKKSNTQDSKKKKKKGNNQDASTSSSSSSSSSEWSVEYDFIPISVKGQADPRVRAVEHMNKLFDVLLSVCVKESDQESSLSTTSTPPPSYTPTRLSSLCFLTSDELNKLLQVWSGLPEFDHVPQLDTLLHELFEETAAQFPDRQAVWCRGKAYSYQQVQDRSNQLAHWLRKQGVGVGSYVGMWLPRGMDVYVVLLSILKSGAAYVRQYTQTGKRRKKCVSIVYSTIEKTKKPHHVEYLFVCFFIFDSFVVVVVVVVVVV